MTRVHMGTMTICQMGPGNKLVCPGDTETSHIGGRQSTALGDQLGQQIQTASSHKQHYLRNDKELTRDKYTSCITSSASQKNIYSEVCGNTVLNKNNPPKLLPSLLLSSFLSHLYPFPLYPLSLFPHPLFLSPLPFSPSSLPFSPSSLPPFSPPHHSMYYLPPTREYRYKPVTNGVSHPIHDKSEVKVLKIVYSTLIN